MSSDEIRVKEFWNKQTGEHKEWAELTFDQLRAFAREIRNEALKEAEAECLKRERRWFDSFSKANEAQDCRNAIRTIRESDAATLAASGSEEKK
jgi:hypothetical protein